MTTTTPEVTRTQHIALLRHLANGKSLEVTGSILGLTRDQVFDIARNHGYPDTGKLSWAADVLAEKEDEEAKGSIPPATATTAADLRARPASEPVTAAASLTKPDEIRVLLNTAKAHPSKRIQSAANKVFDSLDKLTAMLREDQEKNAARRKAEAEKAAAKAEVARLEQQLRDARAKLRGGRATTKPAKPAGTGRPKGTAPTGLVTTADLEAFGVTSKDVRAWAHENDVECPSVGRLPSRVLDAWKAAHPKAGAA